MTAPTKGNNPRCHCEERSGVAIFRKNVGATCGRPHTIPQKNTSLRGRFTARGNPQSLPPKAAQSKALPETDSHASVRTGSE